MCVCSNSAVTNIRTHFNLNNDGTADVLPENPKPMADNYLERKMEEHRNGGAPGYRHRVTATGARPGTVTFPFPVRRIVVVTADGTTQQATVVALRNALVKSLVATGCKVAFTDDDITTRNRIAQSLGACGVASADIDIVKTRWEGIDATITLNSDATTDRLTASIAPYADNRCVAVSLPSATFDCDAAARAIVWCLVPGNDYLIGTTITLA
jgi:hypothetical protein